MSVGLLIGYGGADCTRVDVPGELLGIFGEEFPQVGIVSKGVWADEVVPGGVAAEGPFELDVLRLFGLDGARGEEMLALCDLYPDVDGGVLAFAVTDRWPDGAGKRWQLADQGIPIVPRKSPVPECLASALVVDERSPGCSEFGAELAEDSFELGRCHSLCQAPPWSC
ncbi:hypothetical protein [Streptomyces sp. NPDC085937]|uniref:hypothetical protein n=1 Tax=Streptomyces sp. NPDC085937 TaxID=3365742 RepID=UPI0037D27D02